MIIHASQRHHRTRLVRDEMPQRRGQPIANPRAVVILAGSMRPTRLRRSLGRFVLELPVDAQRTILDCWREQVTALAEWFQLDDLPVRVMIDHGTPLPRTIGWPKPVELHVERDRRAFRGTGGVLRDLADDYADDELLLVASAPQLLLQPLWRSVSALAAASGDVRLLAADDGAPGGLMLVRCGALRLLPAIGFVDLKEQGLPSIAEHHRVMVVRRDGPSGLPLRTFSGYLDALRRYHRCARGMPLECDALSEDWQSAFAVLETGAHVDPSAVIHDSVILRDARVESSAVVVRAVVGPGGVVPVGASIVNRLIAPQA